MFELCTNLVALTKPDYETLDWEVPEACHGIMLRQQGLPVDTIPQPNMTSIYAHTRNREGWAL